MSRTEPCSTQLPAVHDDDGLARLGHDAQVVSDEDDRRVELALQVLHQLEDLRLDRHVEGGPWARRR